MLTLAATVLMTTGTLAACSGDDADLVIYSGRNENLIGPLLEQFSEETGVTTEIRYADSASLSAQILEEGESSPADVFISQDAGALGAIANVDRFENVAQAQLDKVPAEFRSDEGEWVGVSGRARVIAYNPTKVTEAQVPKSVNEVVQPQWRGRVGYAPTNASFQSFVTAMRLTQGEAATRTWLEALKANDARTYTNNVLALEGVDRGEVDIALVNHYYLYEKQAERGGPQNINARNAFIGNGDPGALVNVAGVGIMRGTESRADADRLVEFLLSERAQTYFRDETFEYPLTGGISQAEGVPPLASLGAPKIDLSDLASLQQTQTLLTEVGLI